MHIQQRFHLKALGFQVGEGNVEVVVSIVAQPIELNISHKTCGWFPRVLVGMKAFPTDTPFNFAVSHSMRNDLLDDVRIVYRQVVARLVEVTHKLVSFNGWEIELHTLHMNIFFTVWQRHLISAGLTDSVDDFTRASPQRVKLIRKAISYPNSVTRLKFDLMVSFLETGVNSW